jgi:hypothetical protein
VRATELIAQESTAYEDLTALQAYEKLDAKTQSDQKINIYEKPSVNQKDNDAYSNVAIACIG